MAHDDVLLEQESVETLGGVRVAAEARVALHVLAHVEVHYTRKTNIIIRANLEKREMRELNRNIYKIDANWINS